VAYHGGEQVHTGVPASRSARWTVGFLSPLVHGYYFGGLLAGVVDTAARSAGRVVAVQTLDAGMRVTASDKIPFSPPLGSEYLDAYVVVQDAVPDDYLRELHRAGKPIVLITHEVPGLPLPTVTPDNAGGIRAAVDHLIEHGHRHIGFATGGVTGIDGPARVRAYEEAMLGHGLEPHPMVLSGVTEDMAGYLAARRLLDTPVPPTAIVACTDIVAIGVIRGLREAGLAVPQDVAVIGFDDLDAAATHGPALTTVAQSFSLIGEVACGLALDALRGEPAAPGFHHAATSLVRRESCGCPNAHDGDDAALAVPYRVGSDPSTRFADALILAAREDGVLTPMRRRELSAVTDRVIVLFVTVADDPGRDTAGAVAEVATEIYRLAPQERSLVRIARVLRRYAVEFSAEHAPGDAVRGTRLGNLAHDLAIGLLENQMRSRLSDHLQFQRQRQQYEISTDLLRRQNRNSHSLAWLAGTEVHAGCFAVWESGRNDGGNAAVLTIAGTYDRTGALQAAGERCDVRSFPQRPFLDLIGDRPGDLMYVVSVRFDGSDWGFLALVGSLEMRVQTVLEMFNQWAVLLTVSLDQERAVRSLVRQREEIRLSEERYALAAQAANDGLWDWDLAADTVYYSARWRYLLGLHDDGATADEWLSRVHPDDKPHLEQLLDAQIAGRTRTMQFEHRIRAGDGTYRWMSARGLAVPDENGKVVRLVGSMTDIDDRKQLQDQLRRDALYDGLTGLPNRSLFLDRLNRAIELANRRPDYVFAVLFLDLDSFKLINDSLGHQAGDQVLIQIAERLATDLRTNDTAARFGGDEFAVLVNDVCLVADLPPIVDRIIASISAPIVLGNQTVFVTASAGVSVSVTGYDTAEQFLRDSDTAMYRAKSLGSGASVLFDESMHTDAIDRLRMVSDLRKAVADEEFELLFQPIVTLADRRVVSLEALIRWNHPTRGLISPVDFLPVAEGTGLILPIGRWTIREACRRLGAWRAAIPDRQDLTVSINLSNRQFWDPELPSYVREALEEYDLPPSALIFEITEGVIMHNRDSAADLMRRFRSDGIKLHVDDFGTGYSSLEALHHFPMDALKIDRSFVNRMGIDTRSAELVRIMIAMGRNLDLDVIAEGIETGQEAQTLWEMGCPQVQGYLFSRPVPVAAVPALLAPGRFDAV
jgi:diguanylate cyclase (GGDEF)-like protein/PAS domain S-box-containing protein